MFGAAVSAGNPDGDGFDEIVAGLGPGPTNAARLRGFDYDGGPISPLPGFDTTPFVSLYGVWIDIASLSGSANGELQAGPGSDPSAPASHKAYVYSGTSLDPLSFADFAAYPTLSYGLKVAGETM